MKLEEIAARLKSAAEAELFAINELEAFVARPGSPAALVQTVSYVRQQAEALGRAHRILLLLAAHPGFASEALREPEA